MKRIVFAALALCLSGPVMGEPSSLKAMMTGDDSKGFEAVGRLNIAGEAFCTGALISETLVLTAAHCLYDAETGERYPETSIEFLAGWRNGRAASYRTARRAVVHPDYDYDGEIETQRVATDVALLELDQPIRKSSVTPFAVGHWPRKGAEVGVVSYAFDRADTPSLQETCKVLGRQQGSLILNCDVDKGSSGAPIFSFESGAPRIVSVVSAKAHAGDLPVSLGTTLGEALDGMRAQLAMDDGLFTHVAAPTADVIRRDSGAAGSAKFVRPGG